jgi:hypothetical protein
MVAVADRDGRTPPLDDGEVGVLLGGSHGGGARAVGVVPAARSSPANTRAAARRPLPDGPTNR